MSDDARRRALERARAALEVDAQPAKATTRRDRRKGEPLAELWTIARSGESEAARVAALKVLLAHERPDAADVPDTQTLLRQIAGDPSVAGQSRLRALERVLADEEDARKVAEADELSGAALAETDAALTGLIVAQRMAPPEQRMPRLWTELLGWARDLARELDADAERCAARDNS